MFKVCGSSVLVLGVLACGFLACGTTEVTASGPAAAPRAATCNFDILTTVPLLGYREIGTIDVTSGPYGDNRFTNLTEFKQHIQPNVCQLGGDVAIAFANGDGLYIKATVMKRVESKAAPVAEAAKPASHGCEFDSQCKGDRICVEGKCQAPAASAAPAAPAPVATPVAAPPVESAPVTAAKPTAPAPAKPAAKSAH